MKRLLATAIAFSTLGALPYNPAKADLSEQYEGEGLSSCISFYYGKVIASIWRTDNWSYCLTKKGWVYIANTHGLGDKIGGVDVTYKVGRIVTTIKTTAHRDRLIIYSCYTDNSFKNNFKCKGQVEKSIAPYHGNTYCELLWKIGRGSACKDIL